MTLTGQAYALADGKTPVTLKLTNTQDFRADAARTVRVSVDAGRVTAVKRAGKRQLEITWIPPRLAFAGKATVRAELRGRRRVIAQYVVRVLPATRKVVLLRSRGAAKLQAPASSVLGQTKSFIVRLRRVAGTLPRLHVNVGRLTPVRPLAGGAAEATYTLPTQQFPQMAIIVATLRDQDRPIDWLAIRLFGQAQINTTTEPGAMVTVKLDTVRYGPLRADTTGHVTIGILAPPGLDAAQTSARDRLGNTRLKQISLGAPPYSRVTAVCPAAADRVYVVAVDRHGKALPASALVMSSSRATLGPPSVLKRGVLQSLVTVEEAAKLGDRIKISAAPKGKAAAGDTCELTVRGGPIAKVVVTTTPREYVAGTGKPVELRVALLDARGKPAQPSLPMVTVDVGKLSTLRLDSGGVYHATWTLPDNFSKRTKATGNARVGKLHAAPATLKLQPGAINTITAIASTSTLSADPASTTTITVRAADAHGNPVAASALSYTARGRLRALPRTTGTLELRYTAYASRNRVVDEVTIRDKATGVHTSVPITLTPYLGKLAITARVGFMTDFADISGPTVSANAQLRTALWHGRVFAQLQIGYARAKSTRTAIMPSTEQVSQTVSLVPILAGGYVDILNAPVAVYAGLSAGLAYGAVAVESANTGRVVNTSWSFAFAAALGAHYPVGPGELNLELTHLRADINADPIDRLLGVTQLAAGYRVRF